MISRHAASVFIYAAPSFISSSSRVRLIVLSLFSRALKWAQVTG